MGEVAASPRLPSQQPFTCRHVNLEPFPRFRRLLTDEFCILAHNIVRRFIRNCSLFIELSPGHILGNRLIQQHQSGLMVAQISFVWQSQLPFQMNGGAFPQTDV